MCSRNTSNGRKTSWWKLYVEECSEPLKTVKNPTYWASEADCNINPFLRETLCPQMRHNWRWQIKMIFRILCYGNVISILLSCIIYSTWPFWKDSVQIIFIVELTLPFLLKIDSISYGISDHLFSRCKLPSLGAAT